MQATMLLRHLLYISYAVPASRLRPLVPQVLALSTVEDDVALVSVAIMRCTDVRLKGLPSPTLSYNQVNLRTYVRDPSSSEHSVYFFSCGVTSSRVSIMTHLAGIPWQRMQLDIVIRDAREDHPPEYAACGRWAGELSLLADTVPLPRNDTRPFPDAAAETKFVTWPSIGFYSHAAGGLVRLHTWHGQPQPVPVKVNRFRFPLLQHMGLVPGDEIEAPQSALLVPEERFDAVLPPGWVGRGARRR